MKFEEISQRALRQHKSRLEEAAIWIYEHPTTIKAIELSGLLSGLGLMAVPPLTLPLGSAIALGVTGGLLSLASSVALYALDLLAPPHHDMKTHVYQPGQCPGGKLYYEGDVPILSLQADDPFEAGKAHGYLCGDAINRLTKRFGLVLHTIARQPRAEDLPNTLAKIRQEIPPAYLREMEGLVEGYNEWVKEQFWWQFPKQITVDDILLLHLMPDSLHFHPSAFEGQPSKTPVPMPAVACSAIIDRNEEGFVFARNMDWPSFGLAGAYSLVIHRNHDNDLHSTVEVGVPGLVGTLTGMNDQGLTLAMNVCAGETDIVRGMPASLYNRACLEKCGSVQDVENLTQNESPLGPYHMTLMDGAQAASIHFYQAKGESHLIRRWEEENPLTTLNFRYCPTPYYPMHHCHERQQHINAFFQSGAPVQDALSLPFVNNWLTTHRVVMTSTGEFKVAFDNAFAGSAPLHTVPAQRLLG